MTQTSRPRTCEECSQPITDAGAMKTRIANPWDDDILHGHWHAECADVISTRAWGSYFGEIAEPTPAGHCSLCREANAPDGMCWVVLGEPRARFCLDDARAAELAGVTLVHRPTIEQILGDLEWERAGIGAN